jgi:ParB-like chromosome segregation protein Spo0J
MKTYEPHPIACIFPMIGDADFEKLKADIAAHGLKECGTLYEGKILDGRNRYKACQELGIEMDFCEVELGEPEDVAKFDPLSFVLSHNLYRRHLDESQRAMIAATLADMKSGERTDLVSNDTRLSIDDAAKQLKVGRASVARAKKVRSEGSSEVQKAVESGEIPVSVAAELVKEIPDKAEQTKIVEGGKPEIRRVLKKPKKASKTEKDSTPDKTVDQEETPKEKSCTDCKRLRRRCNDLQRLLKKEDPSLVPISRCTTWQSRFWKVQFENTKLRRENLKLKEELQKLRAFHYGEKEEPPTAPKQKPEHWIEPGEVVAEVKDSDASEVAK